MSLEFLWYIPNQASPGHRGDSAVENHNSLETLTSHANALEEYGWGGALLGSGWGRPDTFTVATALAARTKTFQPLIAIRPGYWRPANFASASATLDHLTGGRVLVNIVSGQDNLEAYGDSEGDQADRSLMRSEAKEQIRTMRCATIPLVLFMFACRSVPEPAQATTWPAPPVAAPEPVAHTEAEDAGAPSWRLDKLGDGAKLLGSSET
jgi:alkanesulfonate monooxygenase SsuD/methylene tetrahydromethanopterin reductase-like flavin-dependent oxidoreductase (luciferase family)